MHAGKQDKERLTRESAALRDENRKLTARNEKLEARNLEVRRQIDTLVDRNKRLQATMARELNSSINTNTSGGCGDIQATTRTRPEASEGGSNGESGSGGGSESAGGGGGGKGGVSENGGGNGNGSEGRSGGGGGSGSGQAGIVPNIAIPAADRSSVADAVDTGGTSRRPRPDQCSDADEVTTPKDTTTGRGARLGYGRSKVKKGEGAAWSWSAPSEAAGLARAVRPGVGAKKRQRHGSIDSDLKDSTGVGFRSGCGDYVTFKPEEASVHRRENFGNNGGSGGDNGGGHGSSRSALPVARPGAASKDCSNMVNLVKKRPRSHHGSSRSSSSSSAGSSNSGRGSGGGGAGRGGGSGGGGEVTASFSGSTRDAQREENSAALSRAPPKSSTINRTIIPAVSDKRVPTAAPRSSSPSSTALSKVSAPLERKRARLSLGPEDRRLNRGPVIEITEIIEHRPARPAGSNVSLDPRQVRFNSLVLPEEEWGAGTNVVGACKTSARNDGGDQLRDKSRATGVAGVRVEADAAARVGVGVGTGTGAEVGVRARAAAGATNMSNVIQNLLEAVPMAKERSRLGGGDAPSSPSGSGRVDGALPGSKQAAAEQQQQRRGPGRRGSNEQPQGLSAWGAKDNAAENSATQHTFDRRSVGSGRSGRSGSDEPDRSFQENSGWRERKPPRPIIDGNNRASTRERGGQKGGTEQGGGGGGGGSSGGGSSNGGGREDAVMAGRVTRTAAMSEVVYPQLAMTTVKSPKKSKHRRRHQQRQDQDRYPERDQDQYSEQGQDQYPEQNQYLKQEQHHYPEPNQDQFTVQNQHQYAEQNRDQDQDQDLQARAADSRPVAAGASGYRIARGTEEADAGARRKGNPVVEGDRLKDANPRQNVPLPSERTLTCGDEDGDSPRQQNSVHGGVVDNSGKDGKGRDGVGGTGGGICGVGGGGSCGGGGDVVGVGRSNKPTDGEGKGNEIIRGSAEALAAALWVGGAGEGGGDASEKRELAAAARWEEVEKENPYSVGNGGERGGACGGREGGRGDAGGRDRRREGGGYEQRSPVKYKYQEVRPRMAERVLAVPEVVWRRTPS